MKIFNFPTLFFAVIFITIIVLNVNTAFSYRYEKENDVKKVKITYSLINDPDFLRTTTEHYRGSGKIILKDGCLKASGSKSDIICGVYKLYDSAIIY
jgi:hypothetical protein